MTAHMSEDRANTVTATNGNVSDGKKPTNVLAHFIRAFLVPTLLGKLCILYFGLNYSDYPDEGYGYGLVASIAFTVTMLGLFIWKYRHHEDL